MKPADSSLRDQIHRIQATLNKTEAAIPGVLPEGEYLGRPWAARFIQAKTGTPGLEIIFGVLEGEEKVNEFKVMWWLADKSLPYVKHDLERLGLAGWTLNELPDMDLSIIGEPKLITLRIEEYEGNQRNRIVKIREVAKA